MSKYLPGLTFLVVCVFGNGMLRKVFGPKREKVTGEWRAIHNEEVYNFPIQ
jgi:hypothetical protein